jgi:hypothetical protein
VFCKDCRRGVCTLCVVDVDMCKNHSTKAFKPLLEELKVDREAWARAQEECTRSAEQLCAAIQVDGDAKTQAITANIAAEVAALQQQVCFAAAARSTDLGNIAQKRREQEELVARAVASPDLGVAGSSSAAVVACVLDRANVPIPPASAAEFRAAAAPAVGHVLVSVAVSSAHSAAAAPSVAAALAGIQDQSHDAVPLILHHRYDLLTRDQVRLAAVKVQSVMRGHFGRCTFRARYISATKELMDDNGDNISGGV